MFLYDANKTMRMLGNTHPLEIIGKGQIAEDDFENLISAYRDVKAYPNYFEVAIDAFMLGYIHGKRAERAKRKKGMTERELFEENIPLIAELALECRKMNTKVYMELKEELLQNASEKSRPFMRKVLLVIDDLLKESKNE